MKKWLTEEMLKKKMKDGILVCDEKFITNVKDPWRNPIEAAVKAIKEGKWEANFKDSIENWKKNVKVDLSSWKKATLDASGAYSTNAVAAAEVWQDKMQRLYNAIESDLEAFMNSAKDEAATIKLWEAIRKKAAEL